MLPDCEINLTAETLTPGGWLLLFNLAMGAVNALVVLSLTLPWLMHSLQDLFAALLVGRYSGIPRVVLLILGVGIFGQAIPNEHLLYLTPTFYLNSGGQIGVGMACVASSLIWTIGLNPDAFRDNQR